MNCSGASGAKSGRVTSPPTTRRKGRPPLGSCRGITVKPLSMRNIQASGLPRRAATARMMGRERHKPQPAEKCTLGDLIYDKEYDCYVCPNGQCVKLEARRPTIGHNLYRRY